MQTRSRASSWLELVLSGHRRSERKKRNKKKKTLEEIEGGVLGDKRRRLLFLWFVFLSDYNCASSGDNALMNWLLLLLCSSNALTLLPILYRLLHLPFFSSRLLFWIRQPWEVDRSRARAADRHGSVTRSREKRLGRRNGARISSSVLVVERVEEKELEEEEGKKKKEERSHLLLLFIFCKRCEKN